jgi:putative membrane protein
LVVTVGIIIGIVLLAIWLVRRLGETGSPASLTNSNASEAGSPKGIAQLRYARGEITRDQYQEILTDLG